MTALHARARHLLPALLALIASADLHAELRLPRLFSDHMVWQQQTTAPIWGTAAPGATVIVHPDWPGGTPVRVVADEDGRFLAELPTPAAGGPYRVVIAADQKILLNDVWVGEVWLASGQSNMEMPLSGYGGVIDHEREIASADRPRLRVFDVARTVALDPAADVEATWAICTPEVAARFSAAAYFFAREIQDRLDVPVGLVTSTWGGTRVEAWTSTEAIAALGEFPDQLALAERLRAVPGSAEREQELALDRYWSALERVDPGVSSGGGSGFLTPEYDDSDWPELTAPGPWETEDLTRFDGIVWMRREVEVPETMLGRALELHLGPIDDMDTVWFNGFRIGGEQRMGYWQTPRVYEVPAAAVRRGKNVVAVRVLDTGGAGGLAGEASQLQLRSAAGDGADAVSLAGPWRYTVGVPTSELPAWPASPEFDRHSPAALYNGMIAPLIPYAVRGFLWYQGESNRTRPAQYAKLFPGLIRDWRSRWGMGDLPFYFVQIAPFAYGDDTGEAGLLRDAQRRTGASVPNTGMAVTMDIGEPRDIHPKNKQDVGKRLALLALARTYGFDVGLPSGPLYRGHRVEGSSIRLFFDYADGGLASRDGRALSDFTLAGEGDERFVAADAVIDGDTVLVSAVGIEHPWAVRFAHGAAAEPNLTNRAGLPASSFCSDDWLGEPSASAAGSDPGDPPPGFRPLFSGEDLSGWRGRPHLNPEHERDFSPEERAERAKKSAASVAEHWRVEQREIVNDGHGEYLTTEEEFGDMELRLDYRTVALADSGIYLRCNPQVQIWDTTEAGGKWNLGADKGSGGLWNNERHERFPLVHADAPFGEWNRFEILTVGARTTVHLNGKLVVDHVPMENYWDRAAPLYPRGAIQLQTHGGEIRFRDLYVRELGAEDANRVLASHDDEGFTPLFNGRDLTGWQGAVDDYMVEDGAIRCRPGRGGNLFTDGEYEDFVVRLEIQLPPGGNNGLAIRYPGRGDPAYAGMCELQVLDDTAEKYAGLKAWQYHGSAYGQVPCDRGYQRPVGEWNFQEVTVQGSRVRVELNGTVILDTDLAAVESPPSGREHPGRTLTRGHFGFAGHGDPVRFRNVRIKELSR